MSAPTTPLRPETLCPRPPADIPNNTPPLAPSIATSIVFRVASLDHIDALYDHGDPGFIYARDGHPNLTQLAAKLAALEAAPAAWAGSSGMAVEAAALLALLRAGDHVALADGIYGKTGRLVDHLSRFGVESSRFDATDPITLRKALTPRTRLVFAETLSNPLVRLADIPALAEVARHAAAPLIIDHTFAPLLCRPLDLGASLVTHSATKFLGGHSDLTLGLIAGDSQTIPSIAAAGSTFGATANPFECWLCLRGLATLPLRVERSCTTALHLAVHLAAHPAVRAVHYPGLPSHPDHARASILLNHRFGAIITLDLGGRTQADTFIRALADSIPFAPSLGDVATTLSHPATTSHRGQPPDQWARQGITPGLIRLSVGLEAPDDLTQELDAALNTLTR